MSDDVIDRLPTMKEVDRALAECRQNVQLLRSIRAALKRRDLQIEVSDEIRRLLDHSAGMEVSDA